jgi:hypothetical protein
VVQKAAKLFSANGIFRSISPNKRKKQTICGFHFFAGNNNQLINNIADMISGSIRGLAGRPYSRNIHANIARKQRPRRLFSLFRGLLANGGICVIVELLGFLCRFIRRRETKFGHYSFDCLFSASSAPPR